MGNRRFSLEEELILREQGDKIKAHLEAQCRSTRPVFETIRQIGEALHRYHVKPFAPRITCKRGAGGTVVLFCEPPCGSNTAVLLKERLLFVDGGFPCYHEVLFAALKPFIPDFEQREKDLFLTHADIDHCGNLDAYAKVFLNRTCAENFASERAGKPCLRERVAEHAPYVQISKILSRYRPPSGRNFSVIGEKRGNALLEHIGTLRWEGLSFSVYQGMGGHIQGETVLVERKERIVFSGDLFINIKDQTRRQRAYNRLAPALLSSVDIAPDLAREERSAFRSLLADGNWTVYGGHGAPMII